MIWPAVVSLIITFWMLVGILIARVLLKEPEFGALNQRQRLATGTFIAFLWPILLLLCMIERNQE